MSQVLCNEKYSSKKRAVSYQHRSFGQLQVYSPVDIGTQNHQGDSYITVHIRGYRYTHPHLEIEGSYNFNTTNLQVLRVAFLLHKLYMFESETKFNQLCVFSI